MQMIIILGKPFAEKIENKMLIFNELMVSGYLYLLMLLTDFMYREDDNRSKMFRETIGWGLAFLVIGTVCFNLGKFFII